jgi:hypothetical protein
MSWCKPTQLDPQRLSMLHAPFQESSTFLAADTLFQSTVLPVDARQASAMLGGLLCSNMGRPFVVQTGKERPPDK